MKIAAVYTGISPQLIADVEQEVTKLVPDASFMIQSDPSILRDTINNYNNVPPEAARRLIRMYMNGITAGADVVYNICSSVGDVADAVKEVFSKMAVPFIRIDEEMANTAVDTGRHIGVLATLPTTLEPTKRLISRCAREKCMKVELYDALAEGVFGKPFEIMTASLIENVRKISDKVDCIVLAQASITICEKEIQKAFDKPVFSSPRFGAAAIARLRWS